MGQMYTNLTGLALIYALGFGCQGLFSQAFGAKDYDRLSLLLKRLLVLRLVCALAVTLPLWLGAGRLLLLAGMPRDVVRLTQTFVLWRLPALPCLILRNDLTNFLLAQRVTLRPTAINTTVNFAVLLALPLCMDSIGLGFAGAALAFTLKDMAQGSLLLALGSRWVHAGAWPTWRSGWRAAASGWLELAALGVPSAVMMWGEWFAWEFNLFLAGALCEGGAACPAIEAYPILSNTMVLGFMVQFGFAMAAGTRTGNAFGAGRGGDARFTAGVALALVTSISAAVAAVLVAMRHQWAGWFLAGDPAGDVSRLVAESLPLVAAYIVGDTLGPGWAHTLLWSLGTPLVKPAALVVFAFWVVGVPLGCILAFQRGLGLLGLWIGLATGMWVHGGGLVAYIYCCGGVTWSRVGPATSVLEPPLEGVEEGESSAGPTPAEGKDAVLPRARGLPGGVETGLTTAPAGLEC